LVIFITFLIVFPCTFFSLLLTYWGCGCLIAYIGDSNLYKKGFREICKSISVGKKIGEACMVTTEKGIAIEETFAKIEDEYKKITTSSDVNYDGLLGGIEAAILLRINNVETQKNEDEEQKKHKIMALELLLLRTYQLFFDNISWRKKNSVIKMATKISKKYKTGLQKSEAKDSSVPQFREQQTATSISFKSFLTKIINFFQKKLEVTSKNENPKQIIKDPSTKNLSHKSRQLQREK
jgi:hypothetical protein